MGVATESDSAPSPVSPDSHTQSYYPESPSQIGAGTLPDLDPNPLLDNIHDFQLQYRDLGSTRSHVLQHQTTQAPPQELVKSSWSRFAIPTKNMSLSSGFAFHPRLYDLKITHDQWHLFSSDIVTASKMSATEDFLAWTTGITTGTLLSPFLLVFSPWVGYVSGRSVHRKTLQKKVKEKLQHEGDLRSILRRWNEEAFMPKGFQAWLELPLDPGDLHKEYYVDETIENKGPKYQKKAAKKAAKRFRIIIIPNDDTMALASSSVPGQATFVLAEASAERETQELHGILLEPPAYE